MGLRINGLADIDPHLAVAKLHRKGTHVIGPRIKRATGRQIEAGMVHLASNPMAMGQLFQMLMLATVVEGRLIGINPYGQPGVEAYKKHMKLRLEGAS